MTMPSVSCHAAVAGPRIAGVVLLALFAGRPASAQTDLDAPRWRIGAAAGAFAPLSSVIVAPDGHDTRLLSAPAFGIEAAFQSTASISIYGSGLVSFPAIRLGSALQPEVIGPSTQVMVASGTAGVLLTTASGALRPTLRLGGGFKWYGFDLTGAESHVRPTAEVGIGFRGVGPGPLEVTAEARYLLSSFDQARLPIRGIAPQDQRQNDLMLTVGVGIRL
jgi:hypothetical protein